MRIISSDFLGGESEKAEVLVPAIAGIEYDRTNQIESCNSNNKQIR